MMVPATAQAKEAPELIRAKMISGVVVQEEVVCNNSSQINAVSEVSNHNAAIAKVYYAKDAKDAYRKSITQLKKCDYDTWIAMPFGNTYYYTDTTLYKTIWYEAYQQMFEYQYSNSVVYYKVPVGTIYTDGSATYGRYMAMKWDSDLSAKTIKKKMASVNAKANKIVKNIKKNWSAKKKLEYIHKYICQTANYDMNCPQDSQTALNRYAETHPYIFTAYGALFNKKCVCQGYAAAFNLLARKAGVTSLCVAGGMHAWNMVYVGKKVSYVDCTWDDENRGKKYTNTFFMKSADFFSSTRHIWDKSHFQKKHFTWAKGL